ncbi:MAG: inositol 2-dehydrogenase [Actinomycetota bacterium]
MTELRTAVLGVGRIGRMHADYLAHRVEGVELTKVYDVFAEAATEVGGRLGVQVAGSVAEALTDVDLVAICTSTDTHVDLLVAAAEAGVPVFCEKPVSLDLGRTDRAVAAIADAGIPVHLGFNRRYDPSHRAVRDAVDGGTVGDLELLRITSRDPGPPPISYIETSGGIFCDMTVHDFDMARYVAGSEVVEVTAHGAVRVDPAIGEAGDLDTAVVVMRHENGTITTIDNSRRAVYGYDQRVEAFGSGGMAASHNHHDHSTSLSTAAGTSTAPMQHFFLERYAPSYLSQWDAVVEGVRSGTPEVTVADGRAALVLGLAAGRSVTEGRPVRVDEF